MNSKTKWILFQFHKGTIKALLMIIMKLICPTFNSIKVQLRLTRNRQKFTFITNFQFHKGTIKAAGS